MAILTVNAGSSSLKYAVFDGDEAILRNQINGTPDENIEDFSALLEGLTTEHDIKAVGHRVVHGGTRFSEHTVVSYEIKEYLKTLEPLAPMHQPYNLKAINWLSRLLPDAKQVACFDTAFHAGQHHLNKMYPLPARIRDKGVIRYGFHGLSYENVAKHFPGKAVIAAHLGSGSSVCAMFDGESGSCSLGFGPLGGCMMGTRPGDLDPSVIIYMMEGLGMTLEEVKHVLYKESGLLGVSGSTNDMRKLLEIIDDGLLGFVYDNALDAVTMYTTSVARQIATMLVELPNPDYLVFTGGIGENSSIIRNMITDWVEQLVQVPFEVTVLKADEEAVIADHTRRLTGGA